MHWGTGPPVVRPGAPGAGEPPAGQDARRGRPGRAWAVRAAQEGQSLPMSSHPPNPPEPPRESSPEPEPGARSSSIGLRVEPRAVGLARGWVRRTLGHWGVGAETVETAALVVSELTTNVLVHAGTLGRSMCCGLRDVRDWLRVEVTDFGGGDFPEPGNPGPWEEHGRGLCLVASLSAAWGVAAPGNGWGQTVWADLPRA